MAVEEKEATMEAEEEESIIANIVLVGVVFLQWDRTRDSALFSPMGMAASSSILLPLP